MPSNVARLLYTKFIQQIIFAVVRTQRVKRQRPAEQIKFIGNTPIVNGIDKERFDSD